MKTIISENKKWTLAVLLSLASITHSPIYANDISIENLQRNDISLKLFREAIIPFIEKNMSLLGDFFDAGNITLFKDFIPPMETNKLQYSNKLFKLDNLLETDANPTTLSKNTAEFAKHVEAQFNAIYAVLKKYNGQKVGTIRLLKEDFLKVFDKDTTFMVIKKKLIILFNLAKSEGNKPVMIAIEELVKLLDRKKAEFDLKDNFTLINALTKRMK